LDDLVERNLHASRKVQAETLLDEISHATFARLRVDADDRLVRASEIGRVDGQVRDLPDGVLFLFPLGETLLDRVLVAAGERGEDELAGPRVTRVDGQVVALGDSLDRVEQVGKVEIRVDTLRVEVDGERDYVDVARPLAVSEQAALYTVSTGKEAKLGGGDPGPAVVVGVETNNDVFAVLDMSCEVLDLEETGVRSFNSTHKAALV
jgi:hypothetical protein